MGRGGSIEHFYHFLLGYLLPLTWARMQTHDSSLILNCGPAMNPLLEMTLSAQEPSWRYWDSPNLPVRRVKLPRWDMSRAQDPYFFEAVANLANLNNSLPNSSCDPCKPSRNIILTRSAQPEFFDTNGAAKVKGFGVGRREITNIPELVQYLEDRGLDFKVYEPGAHTLKCQTNHFSQARKVFGIRGAEWANMIWMNPTASIFMVFSGGYKTPLLPQLAKDLQIQTTYSVEEEVFPRIDPSQVAEFFEANS